MITASYNFGGNKVKFYFEQSIKGIDSIAREKPLLFITDANVHAAYATFFAQRTVIVIPAGEASKSFTTIENIITQLTTLQVTKDYLLVGMGGGVVTDVTGFVASIYMRGLQFAFIPTSLLAMVDAAIGGKNGINVGNYKNHIGTITQPNFILFDRTTLYTLPHTEWVNAFAEVIKYGVILNKDLFTLLQKNNLENFRDEHYLIAKLLYICTHIKALVVSEDVNDTGQRRLLNFGHTAGHAIEKMENIAHGEAIAKGMVIAMKISEEINNFYSTEKEEVLALLQQYELPITYNTPPLLMYKNLLLDKKRESKMINYILVSKIGKGVVTPISLVQLQDLFTQII